MKPISDFFQEFWNTQLYYSSDKVLDSLEWNDFIRIVSTMNIKSCGTKIEKRLLRQNNWEKIRGRVSHGDGKKPDGTIIEIKSSIVSPLPNSGITFRGIRPWHDVKEYYFILVDLKNYLEKPKTAVFLLTNEQIIKERDSEKTLRPYSMKKADRENNHAIELGTCFKNGDLERWQKMYSTTIKLDLITSPI